MQCIGIAIFSSKFEDSKTNCILQPTREDCSCRDAVEEQGYNHRWELKLLPALNIHELYRNCFWFLLSLSQPADGGGEEREPMAFKCICARRLSLIEVLTSFSQANIRRWDERLWALEIFLFGSCEPSHALHSLPREPSCLEIFPCLMISGWHCRMLKQKTFYLGVVGELKQKVSTLSDWLVKWALISVYEHSSYPRDIRNYFTLRFSDKSPK